ncbi:MAG TPA: response regulator [Puia sp.]|jgi:DNA-binding response OmpR family regulator
MNSDSLSPKILMIEGDEDDRFLTKETFQQEWPEGVVDFITNAGLFPYIRDQHEPPQLIIISMKELKNGGMELIRDIRIRKGYALLPIVVLSESASVEEIREVYSSGATSFITKPASYSQALFKIKTFVNYWFHTVELPQ